jgi:8-amino-7-oxononanoate synthase
LPGGKILFEDRTLWDFSSNNYLGLAQHPKVLEAAARSAREGGGSGASRLVSGNSPLYIELEERIAELKRTESALVFSSGYAANLGLFGALIDKEDLILCDRLNHASLIDAARLCGAQLRVYPHLDLERLQHRLKRNAGRRRAWVVSDGVFSMDGDLAPLPDMLEICERYDAILIIDDAHGFGVLGERGGGSLEYWGLSHDSMIVVGTLSKAAGALGGYVAGPRVLTDTLINRARSLIYSTALPPAALGAALCSVQMIPEMKEERKHLGKLSRLLCSRDEDPAIPIVPIMLGESKATLSAASFLREQGYFVAAIRPPTVPKGTARLRISLSAVHPLDAVESLASLCKTLATLPKSDQ